MSEGPASPDRRTQILAWGLKLLLTLFLLALAAQGLMNVWQNFDSLETGAQQAMTAAQTAYALLALLAAAAMWLWPGRAVAMAIAWAVLFVIAVGLIPLAWAPEQLEDWPGFAGGAALAAVLTVLAVWKLVR